MLGKQHKVLDLCDGTIGKAHYYAAKIQVYHKEKPMDAYLIYRIRFFDYNRRNEKYWTSREDMHWWCKTVVDREYFNVDEERAGRRSREDNDPQHERVMTDVSFRPLGHNPHASDARTKISRAAVYKLRHTGPTGFINGVGMNIGSFLEYMIQECKWIEGAPSRVNKSRFRASDFSTPEFECKWILKEFATC